MPEASHRGTYYYLCIIFLTVEMLLNPYLFLEILIRLVYEYIMVGMSRPS